MTTSFTAVVDIPHIVEHVRRTFNSGATKSYEWRLQQLNGIKKMLTLHREEFEAALQKDLGLTKEFSMTLEYDLCIKGELETAISNLKSWMKPQCVTTPPLLLPSSLKVVKEPLGVVLIIAPWNYPLSLCMNPLISAVAAGNCAIIKPSEIAPNISSLIARSLNGYVDTSAVAVVEGAVAETQALLGCVFDHIFYTGNPSHAKGVLHAAAENLTPVTLELGGKCPCIVDQDVDLAVAVKRIIGGKFLNCGQTCVAPDYILAHKDIAGQLVQMMKDQIVSFFGPQPQSARDYSRIVSERHALRLQNLLACGEGKIVIGGHVDVTDRFVAPTIITDVPADGLLMQDEIFGPILLVLTVDTIQDAIRFVNARPKPLAAYIFSTNKVSSDMVLERTSSGAVGINEVAYHVVAPTLPFGGVGNSGMGRYHGKYGFNTFSHEKAVLNKPTFLDLPVGYPPFQPWKLTALRLVSAVTNRHLTWAAVLSFAIAVAVYFFRRLLRNRPRAIGVQKM